MQTSLHAKQLMYRLLHRDPKSRLGSHEGANEIKKHPFFKGVNWALVRCMVLKPRIPSNAIGMYNYVCFNANYPEILICNLCAEPS